MRKVNKNYIKYVTPDIRVKFTPVKGDPFSTTTLDFGGLILSLQTNKNINTLPGTFSITMVGKPIFSEFADIPNLKYSPYEIFRPAGLVEIFINNVNVMVGMIDGITKSVAVDQKGKPQRNFTIVGRDLGALLINHKIWYDDVLHQNRTKQNSYMGSLGSFGIIGGEKSGEIIEKVINEWMLDVVNKEITAFNQDIKPFQFSGRENTNIEDRFIAVTTDKLFYVTKETKTTVTGPGAISVNSYADEYPINLAMTSLGGTLASYLQNVLASPFNEFFIETGDPTYSLTVDKSIDRVATSQGKCYVVFRPAPFDDSNFNIEGPSSKLTMDNLITYEIDDTVIRNKTLNINRNQKFSVYYCQPSNETLGFVQGKLYTSGEYDEDALKRYGYNPMTVQLGGYETTSQSTGEIQSLISDFQKKMKSWYEKADQYLQGSFTVKGDERLRVGNKLNYTRDEFGQIEEDYEEGYYYITNVTHDWTWGRSYDSIINVERGVSKKIFNKEPRFEGILGENLTDILIRIG